jgi:hypothetical protein
MYSVGMALRIVFLLANYWPLLFCTSITRSQASDRNPILANAALELHHHTTKATLQGNYEGNHEGNHESECLIRNQHAANGTRNVVVH